MKGDKFCMASGRARISARRRWANPDTCFRAGFEPLRGVGNYPAFTNGLETTICWVRQAALMAQIRRDPLKKLTESSARRDLRPTGRHARFVMCHPQAVQAGRHARSVICHLSSVICHLSFVLCRLPYRISHFIGSALRHLIKAVITIIKTRTRTKLRSSHRGRSGPHNVTQATMAKIRQINDQESIVQKGVGLHQAKTVPQGPCRPKSLMISRLRIP